MSGGTDFKDFLPSSPLSRETSAEQKPVKGKKTSATSFGGRQVGDAKAPKTAIGGKLKFKAREAPPKELRKSIQKNPSTEQASSTTSVFKKVLKGTTTSAPIEEFAVKNYEEALSKFEKTLKDAKALLEKNPDNEELDDHVGNCELLKELEPSKFQLEGKSVDELRENTRELNTMTKELETQLASSKKLSRAEEPQSTVSSAQIPEVGTPEEIKYKKSLKSFMLTVNTARKMPASDLLNEGLKKAREMMHRYPSLDVKAMDTAALQGLTSALIDVQAELNQAIQNEADKKNEFEKVAKSGIENMINTLVANGRVKKSDSKAIASYLQTTASEVEPQHRTRFIDLVERLTTLASAKTAEEEGGGLGFQEVKLKLGLHFWDIKSLDVLRFEQAAEKGVKDLIDNLATKELFVRGGRGNAASELYAMSKSVVDTDGRAEFLENLRQLTDLVSSDTKDENWNVKFDHLTRQLGIDRCVRTTD